MARNTFEGWIPEEPGSDVLARVNQTSAVEALAKRENMASSAKSIPRSLGVGVEVIGKGAAYGEDETANDEVVLTAKKFGKAIRIADEDMTDSAASILEAKRLDWATSYAKILDNATLGTTAAVGTGVPFVSVYKAVTTADATTGVDYTANTNHISAVLTVSYANLSNLFAKVESSDYFDETDTVVIAHPYFRQVLRGITGVVSDGNDGTSGDGATMVSDGRPIFVEGVAGTPSTLFGLQVRWSLGAKTSATATASNAALGTTKGTAGNPLIVVGAASQLILGIRSGPESFLSDPHAGGPGQLTDEWILNMRSRRGFAVGSPHAFAVLERVTA